MRLRNMQTTSTDALAVVESITTRDLIRLRALAETFPSLARRLPQMGPALLPNLRTIAAAEQSGAGIRAAARFVLSVFDSGPPSSPAYHFDMRQALQVWDTKHAAAFEAWNAARWWA